MTIVDQMSLLLAQKTVKTFKHFERPNAVAEVFFPCWRVKGQTKNDAISVGKVSVQAKRVEKKTKKKKMMSQPTCLANIQQVVNTHEACAQDKQVSRVISSLLTSPVPISLSSHRRGDPLVTLWALTLTKSIKAWAHFRHLRVFKHFSLFKNTFAIGGRVAGRCEHMIKTCDKDMESKEINEIFL